MRLDGSKGIRYRRPVCEGDKHVIVRVLDVFRLQELFKMALQQAHFVERFHRDKRDRWTAALLRQFNEGIGLILADLT